MVKRAEFYARLRESGGLSLASTMKSVVQVVKIQPFCIFPEEIGIGNGPTLMQADRLLTAYERFHSGVKRSQIPVIFRIDIGAGNIKLSRTGVPVRPGLARKSPHSNEVFRLLLVVNSRTCECRNP